MPQAEPTAACTCRKGAITPDCERHDPGHRRADTSDPRFEVSGSGSYELVDSGRASVEFRRPWQESEGEL